MAINDPTLTCIPCYYSAYCAKALFEGCFADQVHANNFKNSEITHKLWLMWQCYSKQLYITWESLAQHVEDHLLPTLTSSNRNPILVVYTFKALLNFVSSLDNTRAQVLDKKPMLDIIASPTITKVIVDYFRVFPVVCSELVTHLCAWLAVDNRKWASLNLDFVNILLEYIVSKPSSKASLCLLSNSLMVFNGTLSSECILLFF